MESVLDFYRIRVCWWSRGTFGRLRVKPSVTWKYQGLKSYNLIILLDSAYLLFIVLFLNTNASGRSQTLLKYCYSLARIGLSTSLWSSPSNFPLDHSQHLSNAFLFRTAIIYRMLVLFQACHSWVRNGEYRDLNTIKKSFIAVIDGADNCKLFIKFFKQHKLLFSHQFLNIQFCRLAKNNLYLGLKSILCFCLNINVFIILVIQKYFFHSLNLRPSKIHILKLSCLMWWY